MMNIGNSGALGDAVVVPIDVGVPLELIVGVFDTAEVGVLDEPTVTAVTELAVSV